VKASLEAQEGYLATNQKVGKAKAYTVKPPAVRDTICKLFSITPSNYTNIVSGYLKDRTFYSSGVSG
jgi:hypothetical protein